MARTQTYHFTNTSQYPVRIKAIQSSCSCATAQHTDSPIEPGQSIDIDLKLNLSSKNGKFETGVQVVFESLDATESVALKCVGTVYPAMEVRNQFIELGYVLNESPLPSGSAVVRIPVTPEVATVDLVGNDQGDFAFEIVKDEEFIGLGNRLFRDVVLRAQLKAIGEPGTRHEGATVVRLKRGPVENSVVIRARATVGHEYCSARPDRLFFYQTTEKGMLAEATLLIRDSANNARIVPYILRSTNNSVSMTSTDEEGKMGFLLDPSLATSGEIVIGFSDTTWKGLTIPFVSHVQ